MKAALAGTLLSVAACTAFLRAGHVEQSPMQRTLVLPEQTGYHDAHGWTKTFVPKFVRPKGRDHVEAVVFLRPHVRALESYFPTYCDSLVVSTNETDGVSSPVRYESQGSGVEVFTATFAKADLTPFARDGRVEMRLCDYVYVFQGMSFEHLLD